MCCDIVEVGVHYFFSRMALFMDLKFTGHLIYGIGKACKISLKFDSF